MCKDCYNQFCARVALLAEGVDRNVESHHKRGGFAVVALLAEGVDRNREAIRIIREMLASPSSRRAWIEI